MADVSEIGNLLHGKEISIYGDAGYIGAEQRVSSRRGRNWYIAEKRSKVKAIRSKRLRKVIEQLEHKKASMRAFVEPPSVSSSVSSVMGRCVTAGWPRTVRRS